MREKTLSCQYLILLVTVSCILLGSCVNTRKATYFNDVRDEDFEASNSIPAPKIQTGDILSISITSRNPDATAMFMAGGESNSRSQSPDYLVMEDGEIQMPVLGRIKALGKTNTELSTTIENRLSQEKLLVDPVVSIRFANFRITVIGEVNQPQVINVPNEKISLLEALGLAGDMTIYAKRDNVLLIREEEGKRTTHRIDFNSRELLTSPFYYLQSNDIVYVQPNKAKIASSGRAQTITPIVFAGLSFATILWSVLK